MVVLHTGECVLSRHNSFPQRLSDQTPIYWVNTNPTTPHHFTTRFSAASDSATSPLPPKPQPPSNIHQSIESAGYLFRAHSNLVSITSQFFHNQWVICFAVTAKGYIPWNESCLPLVFDEFDCIVSEGVLKVCMDTKCVAFDAIVPLKRKEEIHIQGCKDTREECEELVIPNPCAYQEMNPLLCARPIRPGVAICPVPLTNIYEYVTCCTLGGVVKNGDDMYAITAGHAFSINTPPKGKKDEGTFFSSTCDLQQDSNTATAALQLLPLPLPCKLSQSCP